MFRIMIRAGPWSDGCIVRVWALRTIATSIPALQQFCTVPHTAQMHPGGKGRHAAGRREREFRSGLAALPGARPKGVGTGGGRGGGPRQGRLGAGGGATLKRIRDGCAGHVGCSVRDLADQNHGQAMGRTGATGCLAATSGRTSKGAGRRGERAVLQGQQAGMGEDCPYRRTCHYAITPIHLLRLSPLHVLMHAQPGVAAQLPDAGVRHDGHGHRQRLAAGRGHGGGGGHDHVLRHRAREEAQVPGLGG